MIPKLIIIADDARQRHALSDVAQFCGFEILHCLASRQFGETHFEQQPDLWIIDVEDEDDLLEQIGFDHFAEAVRYRCLDKEGWGTKHVTKKMEEKK